ncbi:retrovirus-related pol polyprotein from transposon TNT 1-94 [Tanacetum coccineum]
MIRAVEIKSENSRLLEKIKHDDHDTMIKDFSRLEVAHLNLQLKYQHLKENIENLKSKTSKDAPEFDAFFELGMRDDQIQRHKNTIRKLKAQTSDLKANNSDDNRHLDYKSPDSQNFHLNETVTALQNQLENFKAKNAKIKLHYQELFDSIKVTRVKTTEKANSLQTKIKNLKTQLKGKMPCVTSNAKTPKVSAFEKYAIDVELIPPRQRYNRDVHLGYLNSIKDNLGTLREIVEEARSELPSNTNQDYACVYTKRSQELLENASASCPKVVNKRDKFIATTPVPKKKHVTFADPLETSGNNTPKHVKQQSAPQTNVPTIPSTGVKQTWKPTGKLFTTVGHHWKPTGRTLPLGAHCPLTRKTTPKIVPVKIWKPTGRLIPLRGQCPLTRPTALTSYIVLADPQAHHAPVVQIVLWYLDSSCSKHMTGDRSWLKNFMNKFIGTVRFGNDHFGAIMGYGDYVIGDSVISRVYYVEGLGHNLFSVGQFCDSDLEVAFRKHTCFVRDLDGVDLIKGNRSTNLYTISVEDMMRSSPICLLSKASKNKSWLWHRRLNHLNFGTINDLARKDLVRGLPQLKFEKDHLCSACQLGKSRKAIHKPKTINTIMEVLHTLHMDLYGPMRVFTWVKFLRSKDETPAFVINLLKQLQVGLNKTVRFMRTDNGIEFVNKDLTGYYASVGITHEKTVPRTPQKNGVVERRNRTLVEDAQTMLIFSKALLFLWAEAIATACYTQNRSLIHTLHNKTPYELVHDKKPDLSFLRVFGDLCYPTNDSEDLGKLKAKADIGFFLTGQTVPVHSSSGPAPNLLMPGPISSGLVPTNPPATPYVPPTDKELEILFQSMFDDYFEPHTVHRPIPSAPAANIPVNSINPSVSISVDIDAPSSSQSPSSSDNQSSSVHHGVAAEHSFEVNPFAPADPEPFVNVFAPDPNSEASSSGVVPIAESHNYNQPHEHLRKWTDSHPIDNIIGNPSHPVSTRKQLATDALWSFYNSVLSKVEPKNFQSAVTEDCWFQAMQDEIHEFNRLDV